MRHIDLFSGMKPKLLDLFCGAGGAAMGYHRAGFALVGVDIKPQPRYPFEFHQGDALAYCREHAHEFDVIHASPPCQKHSRITGIHRDKHTDSIGITRHLLQKIGVHYVIENVEGAPMQGHTIKLCGSMFGLDVMRHRYFESSILLMAPDCNHTIWERGRFYSLCWKNRKAGKKSSVVGVFGHVNYSGEFKLRCKAMGIDWMNNDELSQAIPPAYTEFIGRQLIMAQSRRIAAHEKEK